MKRYPAGSERPDFPEPFPPERLWILGAGHFGSIAAERLHRRYPSAQFLVVDAQKPRLERLFKETGLPVLEADAMDFLLKTPIPNDVWVIPAVPVHVAFQWVSSRLGAMGEVHSLRVPDGIDAQVPNPLRAPDGSLYASVATFICPDACNEPDERCTFTKEPRKGSLFELLGQIQAAGAEVTVFRSWQLAPGVGGYPGAVLNDRFEAIRSRAGEHLIATSCRCHGVVNALRWSFPAPL